MYFLSFTSLLSISAKSVSLIGLLKLIADAAIHLATTVLALPKALAPRGSNNATNNVTYTCIGGPDGRTRESWEKYRVGSFFVSMSLIERNFTEDIQKTVSRWGYPNSYPSFHCNPPNPCYPTEMPGCDEDTMRARVNFIQEAIKNFNNFMVETSKAVGNVQSIVDGLGQELVETFTDSSVPSLEAMQWPSVVIGGGLGLLAMIPKLAGPFGIGASLATVVMGIIGSHNFNLEVVLEPQLQDFGNITAAVARMAGRLRQGIEDYTRYALTEIPVAEKYGVRYAEDESELPMIFKEGAFAKEIVVPTFPKTLNVTALSIAITILWTIERAAVIKFAKDEPSLLKPPCEPPRAFIGNSWCNPSDGSIYLLLRLPRPGTAVDKVKEKETKDYFRNLKGVDSLGNYSITIADVVLGTEANYYRNGGKSEFAWDKDNLIKHLSDHNNLHDKRGFNAFNLLFCDLTNNAGYALYLSDKDCDAECEFIHRLVTACSFDGAFKNGRLSVTEFDEGDPKANRTYKPCVTLGFTDC